MPGSASALSLKNLAATNSQLEQSLFDQFPELSDDLRQILQRQQFNTNTISTLERPVLSQDEVVSILQKLRDVSQLPNASLDQETLLYLEQQLADILGFEVTSKIDDKQLPFAKGIVTALPHLQLTPTKRTDSVPIIPEAGTSTVRSYFGWEGSTFAESSNELLEDDELFWVAFPLNYLKPSFASVSDLKQWWKNRRMILINPTDAIAIVTQVKDSFLDTSSKYQFGASPSVIRDGMFWSPRNAGKSFVFFITDTSTQVANGKYTLY